MAIPYSILSTCRCCTTSRIATERWFIGGSLHFTSRSRTTAWYTIRWSVEWADPATRNWIGIALLPQAGIAIGMALIAGQCFPEVNDIILPVILTSTIVFELTGPVLTRWVFKHLGEIPER